jgi:hypothetical protein
MSDILQLVSVFLLNEGREFQHGRVSFSVFGGYGTVVPL